LKNNEVKMKREMKWGSQINFPNAYNNVTLEKKK